MWSARAGFPPGTRAEKTRFWRPTTRSGWAPFFCRSLLNACITLSMLSREPLPRQARATTRSSDAFSARHLEHQLGRLTARPGRALRARLPAGRALPAGDQMRGGQFPLLPASRARLSPYRGRRARRAITASPRSRRIPFKQVERRDICGRGHARHLSVDARWGATGKEARSCCTTSMCRPAAMSPTPRSTTSSATSSISSTP